MAGAEASAHRGGNLKAEHDHKADTGEQHGDPSGSRVPERQGDSPCRDIPFQPLDTDSEAPGKEVLSPEARQLCRGFREKAGALRLAEALKIQEQLGAASVPVSVVVELLGQPQSMSESSMTYALGFDGQSAHTMHLRIKAGRATIFGLGGGR
jgi:hypothetical protein